MLSFILTKERFIQKWQGGTAVFALTKQANWILNKLKHVLEPRPKIEVLASTQRWKKGDIIIESTRGQTMSYEVAVKNRCKILSVLGIWDGKEVSNRGLVYSSPFIRIPDFGK